MTTAHNIDLPTVLAERLTTAHPDVLRELLAEDGAGGVLVHARRDTAVHHGELHDLPEAVLRHLRTTGARPHVLP
mgnify:CR=1 FL=1